MPVNPRTTKKAAKDSSSDNKRTVCLFAAVTMSLVAARPATLFTRLQLLLLLNGL